MPRNTVNSRQTAKTATNDQGPSESRRRPTSKRVSFADKQGDAAATIAQQKKNQEKIRVAQAKTKATADRAALKKQKEAIKRREKEEATRRKEQKEHVTRLEAEVETLRRGKELEEQRAAAARHKQELCAAAVHKELRATAVRQIQQDITADLAAQRRRVRQSIEELMNEAELRESYSPRTLAAMKRDEEVRNGPYEYSVRAVLRV